MKKSDKCNKRKGKRLGDWAEHLNIEYGPECLPSTVQEMSF